jgi:hypothetical protein
MEHDGVTLAFHCHGCVKSLSIRRFLFSHQLNHPARKKKLLEPPWIWKKSGEDSSLPVALNQKTIGAPEKACPNDVIEEAHFSLRPFLLDLLQNFLTHPTHIARGRIPSTLAYRQAGAPSLVKTASYANGGTQKRSRQAEFLPLITIATRSLKGEGFRKRKKGTQGIGAFD